MFRKFRSVAVLAVCVVLLCAAVASAGHIWRCRFCGRNQSADNCPPAGKCDKSPWGTHDWVMQK